MQQLGMDVAQHEPAPDRISVVGTLRGSGGGKSLMLNGHIDTVGVEHMPDPFSAEIRDGKLYGRGAYDMKGSVAAMLAAVKALRDAGASLPGDLLLAAVADEEYASLGTADIATRYQPDAAIVTEPTELQLAIAHKGFVWLEVTVIGKAAHGSRPQLGIDANLKMGRFLHELDRLEQELRAREPHPLIGPPTLHAALINGGREMSVIADRCELRIERRTIPGETEAQTIAEIASHARSAVGFRRSISRHGEIVLRARAVRSRRRPIRSCKRYKAQRPNVLRAADRTRTASPSGPMPPCSPRRAFPRWSSGRSEPGRMPPKNGSICNR